MIFFICVVTCTGVRATDSATVKIGVLSTADEAFVHQQWSATANYLNNRIPTHSFKIIPLGIDEIEAAVKDQAIDFLFANPAIFVQMQGSYDLNAVLTLNRQLAYGVASEMYAGAIITRADHADIQKIADLNNKTFVAVDQASLGGWAMAWRQMKINDIAPFEDLAKLEFLGSHEAVVQAVLEGRADAGTVRTGTLEEMESKGELDPEKIRVLPEEGKVAHQPVEFYLLHSTTYYPEWPLASLVHLDKGLVKHVASALLDVKPNDMAARAAGIAGWYPPANYNSVHNLMKDLRMAQYKHYGQVGLFDAIKQHWHWVALVFTVMVVMSLLTFHVIRLNQRNSKMNLALTKEISEKTEVHHKLLAETEKLNNVFESIAEAYFIVNNHWEVIEMNSQAQELLHKGKESLISENLWTELPELASFAYSKFTKSLSRSERMQFNAYYPPEDKWLEFHTFPSGSEMSVYFRDVTASLRGAEKIKESEQRLKAILDNVLEAVVTIDLNGNIQTFNHAAQKIFGYQADEVIGSNVSYLMPESDAKLHDRFIKKYIDTGETKIIGIGRELYGQRKGGQLFPMELAVNEVTVRGQRMFVGIMRDISERKRAEARIMRLVAAMQYAGDGIFITNTDGEIEYVNPAYESLTGSSHSELEKQKSLIFQKADQNRQGFSGLFDALLKGESWHGQYSATRKDGSSYEEEVTIAPVQDENGKVICYIGVCRDITDKQLQEQRQRRAEKFEAISKMAGGFAHEFNNLLSSIVGYTDLLLLDLDKDSDQGIVTDLNRIMDSAVRAKLLVKQLLDISRSDYEEALVFMPRKIVEEVIALLQGLLPDGAVINSDLEGDVGKICLSPIQFQQIVMNLGLNSIAALDSDDGQIDISLKRLILDEHEAANIESLTAGEYVVLTVTDNGKGIEAEQMEKIFEPAFTTHDVVKEQVVGLAAVSGILSRNHGAIEVESEPGKGASFSVYLPCVDQSQS